MIISVPFFLLSYYLYLNSPEQIWANGYESVNVSNIRMLNCFPQILITPPVMYEWVICITCYHLSNASLLPTSTPALEGLFLSCLLTRSLPPLTLCSLLSATSFHLGSSSRETHFIKSTVLNLCFFPAFLLCGSPSCLLLAFPLPTSSSPIPSAPAVVSQDCTLSFSLPTHHLLLSCTSQEPSNCTLQLDYPS